MNTKFAAHPCKSNSIHKRKFNKQGYIEFKKTGNVVTVFLGALTSPHTIID